MRRLHPAGTRGARHTAKGPPARHFATARRVLRESGRPLDGATRARMEARLGHDFGDVRVHAGDRAAVSSGLLHARAYTLGSHIVFGRDAFRPHTRDGRDLLAHELSHVVQQRRGRGPGDASSGGGPRRLGAADARAESEAAAVASGRPAALGPVAAGTIQREPLRERIRKALEDWRVEVTVGGGDFPVVGQPTVGARRNPDGTWTVVFGNEEHRVSPEELREILRDLPGGASTGDRPRPELPTIPTTPEDLRRLCPPGQIYDFLRLRCRPEAPPRPATPRLELPEPFADPGRFLRRAPGLRGVESATIDRFAHDEPTVPSHGAAGAELDRIVALINRFPNVQVNVDGHADSSGTPGYNERLSRRRAEAIRAALIDRRVENPARLRIRGFGERIPLNEERSADERAQNRRVEVWFLLPPGFESETFRLKLEPLPPFVPRRLRSP